MTGSHHKARVSLINFLTVVLIDALFGPDVWYVICKKSQNFHKMNYLPQKRIYSSK